MLITIRKQITKVFLEHNKIEVKGKTYGITTRKLQSWTGDELISIIQMVFVRSSIAVPWIGQKVIIEGREN